MEKPKRLFTGARRSRACRALALLTAVAAAAVTLAACSESTYWTPAESPKQPQVDWVHFEHRVVFDPRSRALDGGERARLDEFLARIEPRYGDQVLIGTGTGRAEGEIGMERVATVAEYLRGYGLKAETLPGVPAARWDGVVRISVGRYVVTPPRCPDWTKSASYDPRNVPASNFGCATATNLGLMVANPADLVRGREMGPTDGAYAARMIKTWREGDKSSSSAPSSMTLSIGGSGGSGGASGGAP